jgi:hypothetical protein
VCSFCIPAENSAILPFEANAGKYVNWAKSTSPISFPINYLPPQHSTLHNLASDCVVICYEYL